MSSTVTETSNQNVHDIQNIVNTSLPTDASKENAANAFALSLNSEEVKKRAYQDVEELAKTIREIRTLFTTINGDMLSFDSEKFKDTDGKVIQLGGEWQQRIDRFEDVMQASYENARSAVDIMKEITSVLGPDDIGTKQYTYEELKLEVDGFICTINGKKDSALITKDNFRGLADNVRLFSARVDIVLKQADEGLKAELKVARERVKNLTEKLENIHKEIRSLAIGIAAAVAVGVTGGILALFTLSPLAVGVAITSAVTAASLTMQLVEKQDEKKETEAAKVQAQADVETILANQELLKQYVKKFEGTKAQIEEVARKVDTITNIWQTINLDMISLAESLSRNVSNNTRITGFFWAKLGPTKETYKLLTKCLETYVEQSQAIYD